MFTATLYQRGSSEFRLVSLKVISATEIDILDPITGALDARVNKGDMDISPKLASLPREVTLSNGDGLHIDAAEEVDFWLYGHPGKREKVFSKPGFIAASVVMIPVLLFVLYKYAVPFLAVNFASIVPDYAVSIASQHSLVALDESVFESSELDEELQEQYISQWQQLLHKLPLQRQGYNFNFRKSPVLGPNALALPDGTIIVTDEFVELMDKDEDMLKAVILHEIGHVELQHSMQMIAEVIIVSLAVDYFFGDLGGMVELFSGLSATLISNQYSQRKEWEADNYSLRQAATANVPPQAFAKAMEKIMSLGNTSEVSEYLSTHPMTSKRVNNALNYHAKGHQQEQGKESHSH